MGSYDFIRLGKLRGFTERQCRLMELEAVYHGTQYRDAGLPPWECETALDGNGRAVPLLGFQREPRVKAGYVAEKVESMLDLLIGEGRFPTFKDKKPEAVENAGDETEFSPSTAPEHPVYDVVDEMDLQDASYIPFRDLMLKGSGVLAFSVYEGRPEMVQMHPEFCEVVFNSKAGSDRALEIREELEELGVTLQSPRPREHLWTPEGADSHDICFLRYEYVYDEQTAIELGALPDQQVSWRRRIDYLPDQILEYEDVKVYGDATIGLDWQLATPPRPHNWGVIPAVWVRSRGARDGETEGPSFITEAIRSISEAADRTLTRKDESVGTVMSPKAVTIDLTDIVANINTEAGHSSAWRASSREVLSFQSDLNKQGSIQLLEPTGAGATMGKAHLDDLSAHASRLSGITPHDPQTAAGLQSGTAMQRAMAPAIAKVNAVRVRAGKAFKLFIKKLAIALGMPPANPEVQWPPVIALTPEDILSTAQGLTTATGGAAILSQETAVGMFASHIEVEDPEAELKLVKGDSEEAMANARAQVDHQVATQTAAQHSTLQVQAELAPKAAQPVPPATK